METLTSGSVRAWGCNSPGPLSVDVYRALCRDAGVSRVDVRRNYAYTSMEIAVELVEMRRRHLRLLPHTSPFLGALT